MEDYGDITAFRNGAVFCAILALLLGAISRVGLMVTALMAKPIEPTAPAAVVIVQTPPVPPTAAQVQMVVAPAPLTVK